MTCRYVYLLVLLIFLFKGFVIARLLPVVDGAKRSNLKVLA